VKYVEIIVHAFSLNYPQYAALLAYQLSSLVIHPPRCRVIVTICCVKKDSLIDEVISYFKENTNIILNPLYLSVRKISRRSIGRNIAALNTSADIVWFADADYFFGEGVLDNLSKFDWPDDVSIVYPHKIRISFLHSLGDETIEKMMDGFPQILNINESEYGRCTYDRAIGGVQIIKGDLARSHGYLNGRRKYFKQLEVPFSTTGEDIPFRIVCERLGKSAPLEIPNIFRIRHTESALKNHSVP
jgi:hypothetical protein